MIDCPKCSASSGVLQSRKQPNNTMLRRRRCEQCGYRWSTREIDNAEWRDIQATRKKRIKHTKAMSKKGVLARRGFVVPDHLQEEFNHLRLSKGIPSREAARMLGIIGEEPEDKG